MLEYAALAILIVMVTFMIYLVIYIHDIPYEIAKKRDHPHQDAIHVAGWVSLFLLHTIWPLLWIWAYLYKPGEKFLSMEVAGVDSEAQKTKISQLEEQIHDLTEAFHDLKNSIAETRMEANQNG